MNGLPFSWEMAPITSAARSVAAPASRAFSSVAPDRTSVPARSSTFPRVGQGRNPDIGKTEDHGQFVGGIRVCERSVLAPAVHGGIEGHPGEADDSPGAAQAGGKQRFVHRAGSLRWLRHGERTGMDDCNAPSPPHKEKSATPATEGSLLRMVRPEKIPVRRRRFRGTYLVSGGHSVRSTREPGVSRPWEGVSPAHNPTSPDSSVLCQSLMLQTGHICPYRFGGITGTAWIPAGFPTARPLLSSAQGSAPITERRKRR